MFYEHKGMASQWFQLQTLLHLLHRKLYVIEKQTKTEQIECNGVILHVPYEFASIPWYMSIKRNGTFELGATQTNKRNKSVMHVVCNTGSSTTILMVLSILRGTWQIKIAKINIETILLLVDHIAIRTLATKWDECPAKYKYHRSYTG